MNSIVDADVHLAELPEVDPCLTFRWQALIASRVSVSGLSLAGDPRPLKVPKDELEPALPLIEVNVCLDGISSR